MPSERQARRFRQLQRWNRVIPELAAYEDEAACLEDWKKAWKSAYSGKGTLLFLAGLLGLVVVVALVALAVVPHVPVPAGLVGGFIGGLFGALFPAACIWIFRARMRKELHKRLLQRGIRTCVKCGYNLRGQVEPRCPECGTPYDPAASTDVD
jgi:hypothetical protein